MSPREVITKALEAFDDPFAQTHADAIIAALREAGMVVVPREATEAMIEAGVSCENGPSTGIGGRYTIGDGTRDAYAAMIAASEGE